MRYAYVENGVIIKGPCSLPSSWKNISGFNLADEETLLGLGWLPWQLVETPVGTNQVLDGSTITVEATRVVETQRVRDLTAQEIENLKKQQNESQKQNRLTAYEQESDPLFFKWQRGEATQQEWLDKVAEIKARYPEIV